MTITLNTSGLGRVLALITLFTLNSTLKAQNDVEMLDNRILYTKYYFADFFNDTTKWVWEMDVVYRRQSELGGSNIFSNPLRASFRPWIAYQFTKMTRVSLNPIGVFNSAPRLPLQSDLDNLDNLDRPFEREYRTTLQINNYAYYGRFNFTHRMRFESRWRGIDNANWPGVESNRPNHNFRFRYRIRTRIPLNTDYFYTNKTWYISQYSEVHVEFGRDYGTNYFSQNRNYLGIGYRFWDWVRLELGYLHQYNTRGNNYQIDLSRGPMFYLFIDLMGKTQHRR
ncbi:MAG: DUF2490 domain-containing protein [Cryomorphaceae bacterium]|nr:DUF2490 domain-containing protein [Cryomorphaceae bacterium]